MTDPGGRLITVHRHQREAIVAAQTGESYVLTTGTGSGKSLAYIIPGSWIVSCECGSAHWRQGDHRLPDERLGQ